MKAVETERLRDYAGPVTNTDIWDEFEVRPDDVFVCTPPKCGTTWTLNIAMMLIYGKAVSEAGNREDAPWLDCAFRDRKAIAAKQAGLTRRRCMKTHTPLDGISYAAEPTYIVVYRHPVDVHFSLRSHVENMKDPGGMTEMFPKDVRAGFDRFLDGPLTETGTDDLTISSIAQHYQESRARAENGNVHFFHYADMSKDLRGQIERLARILHIDLPPETFAEITTANEFASMRKVAEANDSRFHENSPFFDQAKFFESGTSNKWEGRLQEGDIERYARRSAELLSPRDADWLNWGGSR